MDDPSVNSWFYDEVSEKGEELKLHQLISNGSCGLHIIHGSIKTGIEVTDWNIKATAKHAFQILHDSPATGADYISVSRFNIFPCSSVPQDGRRQKGCWTTTGNMATHLKVAVFWLKRPKSKQPKCRSFESIKEAVEDELTTAKPSFFVYHWSFNLFWQNIKLSHQWFHICVLILWSLSEVWCRLQWSTTL